MSMGDGGRTTADAMWIDLVGRLTSALRAKKQRGDLTVREEALYLAKVVRAWIERNSQLMILVGRYDAPDLGGKKE